MEYHLSVLKTLFPGGINLLSLFSGIGEASIALHRLRIPLKNIVSVEKLEICQTILHWWWEETNQKGNLIHIEYVQDVNAHMIARWVESYSGIDLMIGGSHCNNLIGAILSAETGMRKSNRRFVDHDVPSQVRVRVRRSFFMPNTSRTRCGHFRDMHGRRKRTWSLVRCSSSLVAARSSSFVVAPRPSLVARKVLMQHSSGINVYVPKDRVTNLHQGYGFVKFRSEDDADYDIATGAIINDFMASQDKKSLDVGANLFVGNLDPVRNLMHSNDVDEKLFYDTFSAFGVIVTNPKECNLYELRKNWETFLQS
ncbi:hypothetical protein HYC85_001034 [Camellia sinensis]|uniref:SAM-dependent MTase DRM-type domain-containing protein n=1 Tax=Camellia sinensis TaxID=4442 RepID=A0A7J7I4V1_CAMSI|nr:hypothetical protein HYC85_001034 [Camellia sinensis]